MKIKQPQVLIITGYGINGEAEARYAWQLAGAHPTCLHFNDILATPQILKKYQILMLADGAAFGDHISAGHILALRWRQQMLEQLQNFVVNDGLILGIGNGFQVMVKLGLLPDIPANSFQQRVALTHNLSGTFQNHWVTLTFNPKSPCIFTKGLATMELPVSHAEGRFICPDRQLLATLERRNCVPCRYAHPRTAQLTMCFPHNPNGSQHAIAGICSPDGRMFGLMPRPDAFLFAENHPFYQYQRLVTDTPTTDGDGLLIFKNAVQYLQ